MARALEHRVGLLEDAAIIENLHAMYGYYLATLEWDSLTDLWAPDGTIEIALRGVYVGKPAVRRNLNLYGQQGLDDGVLHNHMQYQPVIDVANDGQTAKMRSRAFSMMGNFGKSGTWMGGIYENTYVKRDGIWRIQSDHVVNTYFRALRRGLEGTAAPRCPRDHGIQSAGCATDHPLRDVPALVPAAVSLREPGDGGGGEVTVGQRHRAAVSCTDN